MTKTTKPMKLELKHLAPYLPYKCKMRYKHHSEDRWKSGTLTPITLNAMREGIIIKLILHPLSDLTKPIQHNGEKFVPMKKFYAMYGDYYENYEMFLRGSLSDYENPIFLQYLQTEQLFEWMFDVRLLIPTRLAIDVNELSSNPYK